ncbi:entericidin [Chelativorans sp.]|uniref:entericidin domain-containing protein n=1 Tax=Chelativorans sp. TaxID=2203393 RepID=UPI002811E048|nr:entericidin [Chelativorans sp.]
MSGKLFSRIAILIAVAGLAAGCANTIRGAGQDTANAVDATGNAVQRVGNAAR